MERARAADAESVRAGSQSQRVQLRLRSGRRGEFLRVAVGTETDGSVTAPASVNGVVGIKPTVGLIGAAGIVPISHSQDTAGPLARSVRDAAILLGAMTSIPGQDYPKFLDPQGLKGARLGVERKFFGANAEQDRLMEECLAEMNRQGAVLVDPTNLPSHGKYDEEEMEVLLYEFKTDLNKYLGALSAGRARAFARGRHPVQSRACA